jgi:hypothetical protein
MAQCDRFEHQRGAGSGFVSDDPTAPLVGVGMRAGYRQTSETTNESARIRF